MYCQRCGRKLEENRPCPLCGVVKSTSDETKKCKKCHLPIPVNANYCIHCGADQAILNADFQSQTDENNNENLKETLFDQLSPEDLQQLTAKIDQKLKNGEISPNVIVINTKLNETKIPTISGSIRLIIKDIFKVNKAMGRANFFLGYIGVSLITLFFLLLIQKIVNQPMMALMQEAYLIKHPMLAVILLLLLLWYVITTLTATIRRYHDAGISSWWIILRFVPMFGEFFSLLLAFLPQSPKRKYDFKGKIKRDKNK